ncbi:hypothetical protein ABLT32_13300 [Bacteroides pyogenes]|uniref:hypothetical protein n=1 Tax=Bacteroides pyogenes TaxID=310300 RepID=UPI0040634C34
MKHIRNLRASEIECRVAQVGAGNKWCTLLLYKDARVDMNLLDEVYGVNGWQRSHEVIGGQLFCTIEIWDEQKKCWVKKQDVGTESYTEAEKGRASDAFKRAGFNVGIGRELYTAPLIFINLSDADLKGGKIKPSLFSVKSIGYNENNEIVSLTITDKSGHERFSFGHVKRNSDESDLLAMAKQEIKAAQSRETLTEIYNNYKQLRSVAEFMSLLSAKTKEVSSCS